MTASVVRSCESVTLKQYNKEVKKEAPAEAVEQPPPPEKNVGPAETNIYIMEESTFFTIKEKDSEGEDEDEDEGNVEGENGNEAVKPSEDEQRSSDSKVTPSSSSDKPEDPQGRQAMPT
ncbi:unnamed protein product [Gongylonema pulchrum]|uniref:RPN2_C domain-containing protein n=1 Tax=Gongylonema pulchrum TaxID=637853 RepID=A0A183D2C8_9BILA|nr:unnamed protein product [Gongylonema pulchrum]